MQRIAQQPTLALGTEQRECQWRLHGPGNARQVVPFAPRLVTDDMLALKQAALRGVGIVALPLLMIRDELDAGSLSTVGAPWQPEPGSVHAVFPSRRGLLPAVRELLDFMSAAYRENARREADTQTRHGIPTLLPTHALSDL
ncbi:LysR substrate binding domain protein [compost metagenome]